MAKFTDAVEATLVGYFNAGDQPTEAQFTALMAAIQEAIDEHDHGAAAAGDGMQLDWDDVWADAVHSHANAGEGGTLDWDTCWTDAVHDHSAAGEGGATLGFTAMTGAGVDVPDGWYLGIGAALEKITFDNAGYITIDAAFFGVNFGVPAFEIHVADAGLNSQAQVAIDSYNDQLGYRPELLLRKSHNDNKGTVTETLDDESLGSLVYKGVNSNNAFCAGAAIIGHQSGGAGAVTVPTQLRFYTSDVAGNTDMHFLIHIDGTLWAYNLSADAGTDLILTAADEICTKACSAEFKENVVDLNIDTNKLFDLRPVAFNWKRSGTPGIGLIAEEVHEAIPELVNMKDEKPFSVKYDQIAVMLVSELAKTNARVDKLEETHG